MPIYEYRCTSCGFQKEFLQKISDPVMTVCPRCEKRTFSKMLTAAGFQLKGSGWYATDFRNSGAKPASKADGKDKSTDKAEAKTESKAEVKAEPKSEPKSESASDTQGRETGTSPACS